ncbi:MAG: hypothetical protein LBN43_04895 [Oscillospiraceae bacterium]|jgi:uncharacterized membrane protein YgcG|nr:hypothetical protein [Oscillospiraceae bacterium]
MKSKQSFAAAIIVAFFVILLLRVTVFALSDSDVEAQVAANGKEAVSGNLFIWFLCAIAFLKISQKIDSFMSALGVNVGHTGGSMMSEMIIAARAVSSGKNPFGGFSGRGASGASGSAGTSGSNGANGSSGGNGASGFMAGGLMGVAARKVQSGAMASATGNQKNGVYGRYELELFRPARFHQTT